MTKRSKSKNHKKSKNHNTKKSCCAPINKKPKNKLEAILFGIIPHIGCIGFLLGSIFGVTILMNFFKPLLMNRYFFHYLVLLSLLLATVASFFYLKKHNKLSKTGIIEEKKYLGWTYGLTIGVNLFLFLVIFPSLANVSLAENSEGNLASSNLGLASGIEQSSLLKIKVDIPCPGHAPLISNELKTIAGLESVKYDFPNYFTITYNSLANKDQILALEVFNEYPAEVLSEETSNINSKATEESTVCGLPEANQESTCGMQKKQGSCDKLGCNGDAECDGSGSCGKKKLDGGCGCNK